MNWFMNETTTKLTVELRELVESGVDPWAFDYPSYYEGEQKAAFEKKVLDHYWFRQIGQETPGRFLAMFRSRIREIMPYYIQLYKSCELMDSIKDPFESYNLTETFEQESTGSGSSSTSSNRKTTGSTETSSESERTGSSSSTRSGSEESVEKHSDTPQGSIENVEEYMSSATVKNGSSSDNLEGSESGSESVTGTGSSEETDTGSMEGSTEESGSVRHTLTRRGNIGVSTLGEEMNKLRSSFLNVDMLVINELRDLFLMIY